MTETMSTLAKEFDATMGAGATVASATEWNSELYLKFEEQRTRAAHDLLQQIPLFAAKTVVDLGCGPGNSTTLLADAFPLAQIIGIDYSDNMLAVARERMPKVDFINANFEQWSPTDLVDLIFANASVHFAANHRPLLLRLLSFLSPNGMLAVQMPRNTHELSHAAMRMVAADGPWAARLLPIAKTRAIIGPAEEYYNLLKPACSDLDIWETSYIHPLDGPEEIARWFEGSGLRPFLELLDDTERANFLARYCNELAAYPREPDGKVLLRYPRLFFVAKA